MTLEREDFVPLLMRLRGLFYEAYVIDRARELASRPPYAPGVRPVTVGSEFPCQLFISPLRTEDFQSELDVARGQADGFVDGVKEAAEQLWPLVSLDPADLVAIHDALSETWDPARVVPEDFAYLSNHHEAWNGPAADQFWDSFYSPLYEIRAHHGEVFHRLARGVSAVKVAAERAQEDALNVLNSTVVSLENLLRAWQGSGGSGGSDWGPALQLFGTVLSVVSAVLTGGAAGAFAAIGAVASYAGGIEVEAVPGQAQPSVEGLMSTLVREAGRARREFYDGAEAIRDDAADVLSLVHGWMANRIFEAPRPHLADGVDGDGFHHSSSEQYG